MRDENRETAERALAMKDAGATFVEISGELGIPIGTVKSWVRQLRAESTTTSASHPTTSAAHPTTSAPTDVAHPTTSVPTDATDVAADVAHPTTSVPTDATDVAADVVDVPTSAPTDATDVAADVVGFESDEWDEGDWAPNSEGSESDTLQHAMQVLARLQVDARDLGKGAKVTVERMLKSPPTLEALAHGWNIDEGAMTARLLAIKDLATGWVRHITGLEGVIKARARELKAEARRAAMRARVGLEDGPQHRVFAQLDMDPIGGKPRGHLANLHLVLTQDTRWTGRLRLNQLSAEVEVDGRPMRDTDVTSLAVWLQHVYGITTGTTQAYEVMRLVGSDDAYHPVADYLDGLEWDGCSRIQDLATRCFGAELTELADDGIENHLVYLWLLSAVARIRQARPDEAVAAKVDTMLILQGRQGDRKSQALEALGGAWYKDAPIDPRKKDSRLALRGAWVFEVPECESWSRLKSGVVKAFLSSRIDHYRPPYGRVEVHQPRQMVFAGTTNAKEFFTDRTGNRRFWPVRVVGRCDLQTLRRERDQIWAEAVVHYQRRWAQYQQDPTFPAYWLDDELEDDLQDHQAEHEAENPWLDPIREFLVGRRQVTMAEVLSKALDLPRDRHRGDAPRTAADCLRELGWSKHRTMKGMRWQR
jgi:predicted P-loop ATPase